MFRSRKKLLVKASDEALHNIIMEYLFNGDIPERIEEMFAKHYNLDYIGENVLAILKMEAGDIADIYNMGNEDAISVEDVRRFISGDIGIARSVSLAVEEIIELYSEGCDIKSVDDLSEYDDSPGDVLSASPEFSVGLYDREGTFLYVDGEYYEGGKSTQHYDLLHSYLFNAGISNRDLKSQQYDSISDVNEANHLELKEDLPIAIGNIYGDMAFIEYCENCTPKDVAFVLMRENFDKIYEYSRTGNKLFRMAGRYFR